MLPPEFLPGNWLGVKLLNELNLIKTSLIDLIPMDSDFYQFIQT
jgi:phenylacetic acid degradation operon negative regulatory protein